MLTNIGVARQLEDIHALILLHILCAQLFRADEISHGECRLVVAGERGEKICSLLRTTLRNLNWKIMMGVDRSMQKSSSNVSPDDIASSALIQGSQA